MKFLKLKMVFCLMLLVFAGCFLTACNDEEKVETNVSSIEITGYQKEFYYGQSFKLSGMMTVNYKDGSVKEIDLLNSSGIAYLIDESGLGKRNATVFYDNYEYEIEVEYLDYYAISEVRNFPESCYKYDDVQVNNAYALVYKASEGAGQSLENCISVSLTDPKISITGLDTSTVGSRGVAVTYDNYDISTYYVQIDVKTNITNIEFEVGDCYYSSLYQNLNNVKAKVTYRDTSIETYTLDEETIIENNVFYNSSEYKVGDIHIEITFDGFETELDILVKDYIIINEVTGLSTVFEIGSEFSFGEAVVSAVYASNQESAELELNLDNFDVSGFDSSKEGSCLVKITLKDCEFTTYEYYVIIVEELPEITPED